MRFCVRVGELVAHVSARKILDDVVRVLEGSMPCYSFSVVDGLYVATGFVVVPLGDEIDDLTLLEATGHASATKDGAEEAAAHALILASSRDFGVVVDDFNFNEVQRLRKENETLRKKNLLLSSGWFQSLDHLEVLQKTLEAITLDAVGGCSRNSIGLLAHGAADWAEENVWAGTGATQELGTELMDED